MLVAVFPQRAGQNKNRIRAAHLGKHRDGFRTGGRQIHKSPSGMVRSRKAYCFHQRMFDQRHAHLGAGIEQKRKNSFRQTTFLNAIPHQLAHEIAGAGMRRMSFDDDRISRGQRRGCVSAGH